MCAESITRNFVMAYLHHSGEHYGKLTDEQEQWIRWAIADGFGNLSEQDFLDQETIETMMYDWSHIRDSSEEAFVNIARFILDEKQPPYVLDGIS